MKHQLLFINGHLNTGGVERPLVDALNHIYNSRYDVDLLLSKGEDEYRCETVQDVHIFDSETFFGSKVIDDTGCFELLSSCIIADNNTNDDVQNIS